MATRPTAKYSERAPLIFAIMVFTFSFGFLFYRTFFGVDLFDEPYYSALTLRLFTGQKLFVDELYLAQTFSILSYPFFKLHWLLNQSMEGIILFQRHIAFVAYLSLALLIFSALRKRLGFSAALLISASCSLFFPGNILTLSYNSLGTLFLTAGLLLLHVGLYRKVKFFVFLSGLVLGLSSIAYVTFCGFTALLFFYLLLVLKNKTLSLLFATGVALTFIYPVYFILSHLMDFRSAMDFGKEYLHSTPSFSQTLEVIHKFFPKMVIGVIGLFGLIFYQAHRSRFGILFYLLGMIPLVALLLAHLSWGDWNLFPFYLTLLSFLIVPLIHTDSHSFSMFLWIFIPSFAAGLITSLTSASGHINSQVGLVPACLVGLSFIFQAMKQLKPESSFLPLVPVTLPLFFILLFPLQIWSDAPFNELTAKVERGPFKGIYTTPQKESVLEKVYTELKPLLETSGPLLVYPNFPSIYLISPVPPAKGVTWYQDSGRTNEILAGLYKKQINPNSRVVRMKIGHGAPIENPRKVFDSTNPLNHLIESTHTPIKDTDWYTLFAPK